MALVPHSSSSSSSSLQLQPLQRRVPTHRDLPIGLMQILTNPLAAVRTATDPRPIVLIDVKLSRIIEMQESLYGAAKSAFYLGDQFVILCKRALVEGSPIHKTMAILIFYSCLPGHEDVNSDMLIESRPRESDIVFEVAFIANVLKRLEYYVDGKKPNYHTYPMTASLFVVDKLDKAGNPQVPETRVSLMENTSIGVVIWAQNAFRRRIPLSVQNVYLQQESRESQQVKQSQNQKSLRS